MRPVSFNLNRAWFALGLLLLASGGCQRQFDQQTRDRFLAAERQFAQAATPDDYLKVAAAYQQLLDGNHRSVAVFYNQGLAYQEAGQPARAIASFRQAQQLEPRNDLVIEALRRLGAKRQVAAATWYDAALRTTQGWLGVRQKCWVLTGLLATTMFVTLIFVARRAKAAARVTLSVALVPSLLLGISIAMDAFQLQHHSHAVVLEDCALRRGPAELHTAVLANEVPLGTELLVTARRNDWVHVVWPDHGEGWLPQSDLVIY